MYVMIDPPPSPPPKKNNSLISKENDIEERFPLQEVCFLKSQRNPSPTLWIHVLLVFRHLNLQKV